MMNIKAISTNVGKALLVSALFMFLSMIVSVIYGRDDAFGPLLISFIITLIVGAQFGKNLVPGKTGRYIQADLLSDPVHDFFHDAPAGFGHRRAADSR